MDEPINFDYRDTDSYENEISELYSYSEEAEFLANRNAFEESMEDCGLPLTWKHMVNEQKMRAVNHLMTTLEVSCRVTRIKSCRALAYLIQGNFGECLTLEEQAENTKENVALLYQHGIFHAFVEQLTIEANIHNRETKSSPASASVSSEQLFNESSELRLILSVLYTITETMYHAKDCQDEKKLETRRQFVRELQNPFGDELLSVTLFQMLNNFCGGHSPHYPVRKITLLLWKVILITLGGSDELKALKERKRKMCNLDPVPDDTMEVIKNMSPCSPPMMPEGQARARAALTGGMMANKRKVFKQPAFDDALFAYAKECLLNSLTELNQTEDSEGEPNQNPNEQDDDSNEVEPSNSHELDDDSNGANDVNASNNHSNQSDETNESGRADEAPLAIEEAVPYNIIWNGRMSRRELQSMFKNRDGATNDQIDLNDTFLDNSLEHFNVDGAAPTAPPEVRPDDDDRSSSSDSGIIDKDNSSSEKATEGGSYDELNSDNMAIQDVQNASDSTTGLNQAGATRLRPETASQLDGSRSDISSPYKGLPWTPKVRKADLQQHLTNLRQKFLGYTLTNDLDTTFGLPEPIVEGINVLRRHLYVSLAEIQLERDEEMQKFPLTHSELDPNYRDEVTERLYSALLPRLPQHMIALLKILLAASTLNTKNKSDRVESINIMAEINPDVSSQSIIQTVKMNVDALRHKEIIIKSISAILLLLLKHFKVNHVYQFEYVSQQLMFANCIPLILKFLSQDTYSYIVKPRSTIWTLDFPACVIGEQPELTTVAIELSSLQPYCWRNMFSCINLVRVLNKLTKWKHSRIMMLVVFKSSQTLLKALSVRNSMFQLYVLKLLKVQLKFLGRQWKKSNMKLISPIYQKVRHRLTDDWAYSNDNEARPWDFQAEEFTLQANINRFHQRRYHELVNSSGNSKSRNSSMVFEQFDKLCLDDTNDEDYDSGTSDLCQISPNFERNYEKWLDSEVFQRQVDWDKLVES